MQHDRGKILRRMHALESDPLTRAFLMVELTARLRDDELCQVVDDTLRWAERAREAWEAKTLPGATRPEEVPESAVHRH